MKELILLDFEDDKVKTGINLDSLDDILRIDIQVLSGDEIAHIIYKNGDARVFDSGNDRIIDFHDGTYCIYQAGVRNDIDNWLKRKSSYDYFW